MAARTSRTPMAAGGRARRAGRPAAAPNAGRVALPPDRTAELRRLAALAELLDARWRIPGTGIRIGLDGIASIVPVLGDSATALVAAYLVAEAARLGVPKRVLVRMAGNVGIDWLFGSIPLVGTIFDIGFKANLRNLRLLRRHLEQEPR